MFYKFLQKLIFNKVTRNFANLLEKNFQKNYYYKFIKFRLTRFLIMRGLRPPFCNSMGCDLQYWGTRNLETNHSPEQYIEADITTERCFEKILPIANKNFTFLDIGCNAGRNLNYLYEKGFRNLSGLEVNQTAVNVTMKKYFPDLYKTGKFYVGNAAEEIKKFESNSIDVVFSIGVLIHIEPKDKELFREMVRVSKKYIVVMTGENSYPFPYDFRKIFIDLGCKEIYYCSYYGDLRGKVIPTELFDKKKYLNNESFLRIFIKNK